MQYRGGACEAPVDDVLVRIEETESSLCALISHLALLKLQVRHLGVHDLSKDLDQLRRMPLVEVFKLLNQFGQSRHGDFP